MEIQITYTLSLELQGGKGTFAADSTYEFEMNPNKGNCAAWNIASSSYMKLAYLPQVFCVFETDVELV